MTKSPLPLPKYQTPNPNHSTPFFQCNTPVAGHSHGDFPELGSLWEETCFQVFKNVFQLSKLLTHLIRIICKGGYAHYASNPHILKDSKRCGAEQFYGFCFTQPKLSVLLRDVKLDQAINYTLIFKCLFINFL